VSRPPKSPPTSLRGLSFADAQLVRNTRNRALFRELNERIAELQRARMFIEFACECSDPNCAEAIVLNTEEYEAVRRRPTQFVVLPSHVGADDQVLTRTERYAIVETHGVSASVARELDPRAAPS
jgi:hypothetical protein